MEVFNLIYTKVAPDDSPWGEKDFHTVFYPINLLQREDVFELEKRIHFPKSDKFDKKETVFFFRIKEEYYFVIFHIRNLPDARDMYGRGGIFLCHGFIFPKELWQNVSSPLSLFDLVKDSLFKSREDVLLSPLVNKKTGNISPIEVSQEKLRSLSMTLPKPISEFDWRMVILLNNFARLEEQRPVILLKGEPDRIFGLMHRLISYLPDNLKVNIGWDPVFDGGNFTFYPLKIAGFKNSHPMGGSPITIDIETFTIKETSETSHLLFLPQTPYEKWLDHCWRDAITKEQIEKAYSLSLILEGKIDQISGDVLTERSCFVSANQQLIKDAFLKRCSETVGQVITQYIADELDVESMLDLIIENFPLAKLAGIAENIIIKKGLVLKNLKTPLSDSLINAGGHRLKLIAKVWKGEVLKHGDLEFLEKNERVQLIRYLLLGGWSDNEWVTGLLKEEGDILEQLLSSYDTRETIKKILLRVISKEKNFKGIEKLLLSRIIQQKREYDLLYGKIDFYEVIEDFLKDRTWNDEDIKEIFSWSKNRKPPQREFPYIKAFLYPERDIHRDITKNKMTRKKLIECLIDLHGYKVADLERLGIILEEKEVLKIEEKIKSRSVIGKIKGLWEKFGGKQS